MTVKTWPWEWVFIAPVRVWSLTIWPVRHLFYRNRGNPDPRRMIIDFTHTDILEKIRRRGDDRHSGHSF